MTTTMTKPAVVAKATTMPDVGTIQKTLSQVGYFAQREDARQVQWLLWQKIESGLKILLLRGLPGVGKTYLAECIPAMYEKLTGVKMTYLPYLCHAWTDKMELMLDIDVAAAVAGKADEVDVAGVLTQICLLSKTGPVLALFDEVDKTEDRAQNMKLDFTQYCRAQYKPGQMVYGNPENIFLVMTDNESKPLSGPMMRRVTLHHMHQLPFPVLTAIISDQLALQKPFVGACIQAAQSIAKEARREISLQELRNFVQCINTQTDCPHDVYLWLTSFAARSERYLEKVKTTGDALWSGCESYSKGETPEAWKVLAK